MALLLYGCELQQGRRADRRHLEALQREALLSSSFAEGSDPAQLQLRQGLSSRLKLGSGASSGRLPVEMQAKVATRHLNPNRSRSPNHNSNPNSNPNPNANPNPKPNPNSNPNPNPKTQPKP